MSVHHFKYLGFFQLNNDLDKDFGHYSDCLSHRTIEEQLVDGAETAQLNDELVRTNSADDSSSSTDAIKLRLLSGALQFVNPNSPIPFERIPLHKIKHIVSFENGRGGVNVLLVESFAYSPHHRLSLTSRCHLLETERGDDNRGVKLAEELCKEFRQKFEEILAKLEQQQ